MATAGLIRYKNGSDRFNLVDHGQSRRLLTYALDNRLYQRCSGLKFMASPAARLSITFELLSNWQELIYVNWFNFCILSRRRGICSLIAGSNLTTIESYDSLLTCIN